MATITLEHLRDALGDKFIEGAEYKLKESHASARSALTLTGFRPLATISIPGMDSATKMDVYVKVPKAVKEAKIDGAPEGRDSNQLGTPEGRHSEQSGESIS